MTFIRRGTGNQLRDCNVVWVFDGEWFVERDNDRKQIIKRQVVPPGERFDPFSLKEGVFPMPIGQPKDDVLARFDVEMIDLAAGGQDSFLAKFLKDDNVWGLKLVPDPGTPAAEEFAMVHLFYDRALKVPVGIDVFKPGGNRDTILFLVPKRNEGVDEAVFDTSLPEDGTGWKWTVEPWRDG